MGIRIFAQIINYKGENAVFIVKRDGGNLLNKVIKANIVHTSIS